MFLSTGSSLESQLVGTGKGTKPHTINVAQRLMADILPIVPFGMLLVVSNRESQIN